MIPTAVCCAAPEGVAVARQHLTQSRWTALGALAIPLWALWPSLALHMKALPPLEALAFMFSCGFLAFRVLHVGSDEPRAAASLRGWVPSLVYAAALAGGDLCFLLATHRLPAAQANLLSYLWPVLIGMLAAAAGLFRLKPRQVLGLALGFCGALILMWDGRLSPSLNGIALAVGSGALWAAYCVFRLAWKEPTGNLLARGCGISAVVCAVLHLVLEQKVRPDATALAAMATSSSRSGSATTCGIKASGAATATCSASWPMPRPCAARCCWLPGALRSSPGTSSWALW